MVSTAAQSAEPPIVPGTAATGMRLDLVSKLSDYRRHPNLTIKFERLPPGARLSRGRNTGDGTWSLRGDELDDVFYLPPNGIAAPAMLTLRVITTERDEATVLTAFDLDVREEAAPPLGQPAPNRAETREPVDAAEPPKTGVDRDTIALLSRARESWRGKCEKRAAEAAALSKADMEAFMTERARRLGDAVARAEAAELALTKARARIDDLAKRADDAEARAKDQAQARDQEKAQGEAELQAQCRAREHAERELARLREELSACETAHAGALEEARRTAEEKASASHAAAISELEKRHDEELAAQADAIVARLKTEFMDQMDRARADWQRESTVSIGQMMERAERAERDLAATQARTRELDQARAEATAAPAAEPDQAPVSKDSETAPENAMIGDAAPQDSAATETQPEADAERPAWERELEARLAEARAAAEDDAERRLDDARAQWELETEAALANAMESWKRDEAERLAKARERWQKNQSRKIATRASKRGQKTQALRRMLQWGAAGVAVVVLALSAPRLIAAFNHDFGPQLTQLKTGARQLGSKSLAIADEALRSIRTQFGDGAADALGSAVINVDSANLRAGPSTSASVAGTLQRADQVSIVEMRGNWVRVRLLGVPNTEGWVHGSLLKVAPAAAPAPAADTPSSNRP